ncbi:MAG: response regulator transcription factor [Hydrogenophilaceae bacterium]|jgi:two-component system OmpR family response regulator|nr:response regulator transcription factor [Hydrogenophilaceae bacterium]
MRVLLVEDDKDMAAHLRRSLEDEGHDVELVEDGAVAEDRARARAYDVIILDRMLPKKSGADVVLALRESGVTTPVIMVSALREVAQKVEGLDAGADDYLGKPFATEELLARVRALHKGREMAVSEHTRLTVADLEMDLLARTVHRGGKKIDLQPREFRLLEYLMRNAGQTVTRKMLLENVWDYHFDPQTNVIDVHISRLRSKIDKDYSASLLHTVRGSGYRLEA